MQSAGNFNRILTKSEFCQRVFMKARKSLRLVPTNSIRKDRGDDANIRFETLPNAHTL
jgi:hypothetical protein